MKLKYLLPTLALALSCILPAHVNAHKDFYLTPIEPIESEYQFKENIATLASSGYFAWAMHDLLHHENVEKYNIYGMADRNAGYLNAILRPCRFHTLAELNPYPHSPEAEEDFAEAYRLFEHWKLYSENLNTLVFSKIDNPIEIHENDTTEELYALCPEMLENLSLAVSTGNLHLATGLDTRVAYYNAQQLHKICAYSEVQNIPEEELKMLERHLKSCAENTVSSECDTLQIWTGTDLSAVITIRELKALHQKLAPSGLPILATVSLYTLDIIQSCLEAQGYSVGTMNELLENTLSD